MKIWVDDIRPAPKGYIWCRSVNEAKYIITRFMSFFNEAIYHIEEAETLPDIELIDLDHDLGEYATDGGDAIKLLDWLEQIKWKFTFKIHSMNPVGVENMRRIIQKNGWEEIR